ncbi:hypothetical protein BDR03DRAFT_960620, partial [Suillus americanus]
MYFRAAQIPLCSLSKCLTLHLGEPTSNSHIWLNDRAAGYNYSFSPEFVNVPHSDVEICLTCYDMACCWAIAINQ